MRWLWGSPLSTSNVDPGGLDIQCRLGLDSGFGQTIPENSGQRFKGGAGLVEAQSNGATIGPLGGISSWALGPRGLPRGVTPLR
jgi:hypothetical protein